MKKISLLFAAVMACTLSFAQAPEKTLNLKDKAWGFPTSYIDTAATYKNGTDTIVFAPGTDGKGLKLNAYDGDTTGLLFGKTSASITLSSIPFEVEKIVVCGVFGASGKVTFNVFVGETAVSKEVTSCTIDQTFYIDKAAQVANTKFSIKITNSNNIQISKIEIYKKATGPSITCDNVVMGNVGIDAFNTKTVKVIGSNLSAAIVPSMKDGSNFSVAGTLTADGGEVTITAIATAAGAYKDTLVLTSGETVKKVEVTADVKALSGKGTEESPLSVADLQILNNPKVNAWVVGYIVGSINSNKVEVTPSQVSNIALSDTKVLTKDSIFAPVQLPAGDIRAALNVVDNEKNIGKKVKVYGSLEAYFQLPGVKSVTEYEFIEETAVDNINDAALKAKKVIENGQLVIIDANGVRYNAIGVVIK